MNRKMLLILVAMFIIISGYLLITTSKFESEKSLDKKHPQIQLVTSFYPMYILALNLTDQVPDIKIENLTANNTGCLHDYQLTTQNMKILNSASLLLLNGGGMESFMRDALTNYPDLPFVNVSQGITMLSSNETGLNALHEETSNRTKNTNIEGLFTTKYNPHVWLNPKLYIIQIQNMRDGLIKYLKNRTDLSPDYVNEAVKKIEENAQSYIDKVKKLNQDIEDNVIPKVASLKQKGRNNQVVIFHDAFSYLADRIGLKVAYAVDFDADTQLSAGEIAKIIDLIKKDKIPFLFTEQQFGAEIAERIKVETGTSVYVIDTAVTGDGSKASYLTAMLNNIQILIKALK